jgi:hypothetical protein
MAWRRNTLHWRWAWCSALRRRDVSRRSFFASVRARYGLSREVSRCVLVIARERRERHDRDGKRASGDPQQAVS